MTDRRLPTIVLGGTNSGASGGDGAIHDPLLHPRLYEGVALRRMLAFFLDMILMGIVLVVAGMGAPPDPPQPPPTVPARKRRDLWAEVERLNKEKK